MIGQDLDRALLDGRRRQLHRYAYFDDVGRILPISSDIVVDGILKFTMM